MVGRGLGTGKENGTERKDIEGEGERGETWGNREIGERGLFRGRNKFREGSYAALVKL